MTRRRIRVNAALYQVALVIGAPNSEAADFGNARLVAFENPPLHKPKRLVRALVLTQPSASSDSPRVALAEPADGVRATPVLHAVGNYVKDPE